MEVALTREEAWQMETMEISNRMTGLKGKRSLPVNIQPWLFFNAVIHGLHVQGCTRALHRSLGRLHLG